MSDALVIRTMDRYKEFLVPGGRFDQIKEHIAKNATAGDINSLFFPSPTALFGIYPKWMYDLDLEIQPWLHGEPYGVDLTWVQKFREAVDKTNYKSQPGRAKVLFVLHTMKQEMIDQARDKYKRHLLQCIIDETRMTSEEAESEVYNDKVLGPNGRIKRIVKHGLRDIVDLSDVDCKNYEWLYLKPKGVTEEDLKAFRKAYHLGEFKGRTACSYAIECFKDKGLRAAEGAVGRKLVEELIRSRPAKYPWSDEKRRCNDIFVEATVMSPPDSVIVFLDTPDLYTTTRLLAAGISLDRMVCPQMDIVEYRKMKVWPHVVNQSLRNVLLDWGADKHIGALWMDYYSTWSGTNECCPEDDMWSLARRRLLAEGTTVCLTLSCRGITDVRADRISDKVKSILSRREEGVVCKGLQSLCYNPSMRFWEFKMQASGGVKRSREESELMVLD